MGPPPSDHRGVNAAASPVEPSFLATLPNPPPLPPSWPRQRTPSEHGYDPDRVYGVKRRFSLATVMVMMAGASLILAGMNALNVHPVLSGTIVLLCVVTAIGQMFLFRGKHPRNASLVVGAAFCGLAPLVTYVAVRISHGIGFPHEFGWVLVKMLWGVIYGPLPGYVAGCLVAGVLLVMDLTESVFARWRKAREPDDDPWPPPKNPAPIIPSVNELQNAENVKTTEKPI
jgi:hypothetical protein